jgi:hypothetical protein
MNANDDSLQRLFRAAARAREVSPEEMPEAMKARILARAFSAPGLSREPETPLLWLLHLRRALVGAVAVMVVCLVWGWMADAGRGAGVKELATYEWSISFSR